MRSPYGRRLAEARRASGLSREFAAVSVNKSYSTIAGYETGYVIPPLDVVVALAALYEVSIGALVGEAVTADVA